MAACCRSGFRASADHRQGPVGPVAAFAPWNFPAGNPARKIGAALAAGCLLKPAEESAGTALAIARAA
jgi:succinate-semialdehyde dehydrogenase/glutarate-semialdehyde dehydrogenase